MRRIMLLVGLALLMATFVVVSALPAIAAPPDKSWSCSNGSFSSTNEASGFQGSGQFIANFRHDGGTITERGASTWSGQPFPSW